MLLNDLFQKNSHQLSNLVKEIWLIPTYLQKFWPILSDPAGILTNPMCSSRNNYDSCMLLEDFFPILHAPKGIRNSWANVWRKTTSPSHTYRDSHVLCVLLKESWWILYAPEGTLTNPIWSSRNFDDSCVLLEEFWSILHAPLEIRFNPRCSQRNFDRSLTQSRRNFHRSCELLKELWMTEQTSERNVPHTYRDYDQIGVLLPSPALSLRHSPHASEEMITNWANSCGNSDPSHRFSEERDLP